MKLSIIFFFVANFLFAQKADLTGSIIAFNKEDIETAKELIDIAHDKYMKKISDGTNKDKPKIMSKFWHYRGQIYLKLGDLDVAIESFKKDLDLNAKGGFQKKSISSLNLCAAQCLNQADESYKKALELFEKNKDEAKKNISKSADMFLKTYEIRKNPSIGVIDTASLFNACLLYSDIGDSNSDLLALEQARKLVDLDPKDEKFQVRLLVCLEKKGDKSLLKSAIDDARSNIPSSQDIINREVNYYISIDDKEGLKKSLNTAIQSDSQNPVLHFALGTAMQSLGDNDGAKESYLKSIELDSNYFDAHNNIASMYLDETASLIKKMNKLGSSSSDQKKYNNYKKKRDNLYNQSIPHLEDCIKIQPDNITILNVLKELYYKVGDIKNMKRIKSQIDSL